MAPLNPEVRLERFLAGQRLTPAVRLEYFLAGAAGYGLAALQNESAAISAGGTGAVNIPDAAGSVPFQSIITAIDPVQEGSGDPAPDNLRPISGHTGATLNVTGKNLWKFNASYQSASSGTLISNQAYVLKAGTYTLSMKGSIGAAMAVTFRDSGNNVIVTKTLYSASFVDGYCATEITLTKQSAKLNIYSSGAYDISEIQLEVGATAHAYEEPTATSYSVTFGQTVYGGTFDFVSGKLSITHAYWTDNGSVGWNRNADGSFFVYQPWAALAEQSAAGCYCNYAPFATSFSGMSVFVRPGVAAVSLGTGWGSIYESADALKEAFADTPFQIVYKLATPIEIDLDDLTIPANAGINNIWSDVGNVLAVEYKQDPEASANEIKALIAPVLPEMKADANLVANDFRIVGNTLYKITANIAAGGTLTPGSNCTATTVGEQLKALLNA